MADNITRPFGAGPGGTAGRPPAPRPATRTASPAPGQVRSAYQQRVDQMKVRIVELSHRNMENAMRILRSWLADKGDDKK